MKRTHDEASSPRAKRIETRAEAPLRKSLEEFSDDELNQVICLVLTCSGVLEYRLVNRAMAENLKKPWIENVLMQMRAPLPGSPLGLLRLVGLVHQLTFSGVLSSDDYIQWKETLIPELQAQPLTLVSHWMEHGTFLTRFRLRSEEKYKAWRLIPPFLEQYSLTRLSGIQFLEDAENTCMPFELFMHAFNTATDNFGFTTDAAATLLYSMAMLGKPFSQIAIIAEIARQRNWTPLCTPHHLAHQWQCLIKDHNVELGVTYVKHVTRLLPLFPEMLMLVGPGLFYEKKYTESNVELINYLLKSSPNVGHQALYIYNLYKWNPISFSLTFSDFRKLAYTYAMLTHPAMPEDAFHLPIFYQNIKRCKEFYQDYAFQARFFAAFGSMDDLPSRRYLSITMLQSFQPEDRSNVCHRMFSTFAAGSDEFDVKRHAVRLLDSYLVSFEDEFYQLDWSRMSQQKNYASIIEAWLLYPFGRITRIPDCCLVFRTDFFLKPRSCPAYLCQLIAHEGVLGNVDNCKLASQLLVKRNWGEEVFTF